MSQTRQPIRFSKRLWALLVCALLVSAAGCAQTETTSTASVSQRYDQTLTEPEQSPDAELEPEPEEIPLDTCLAAIESVLSSNYGENYGVELLDDQVSIGVWVEGVALSASAAVAGDEASLEAWNAVMDAMTALEESFQSVLDDSGHSDIAVCLNVINDLSTDSILASISGGEVTYDPVNGIDLYGAAE